MAVMNLKGIKQERVKGILLKKSAFESDEDGKG